MIRLSPTQRDILLHRLECPECIAEALAEEYPKHDVEQVVDFLASQLAAGAEYLDLTDQANDPVTCAVLIECLEGSTWLAGQDEAKRSGELTRAQHCSKQVAFKRLQMELEAFYSIPIEVP